MATRGSRSRKTSGDSAQKVIWFLFVAGLIFAFFQVPYDPGAKGMYEIAKSKSENVQAWVGSVDDKFVDFIEGILIGGDNAPPGTPGTDPDAGGLMPVPPGAADGANTTLDSLPTGEASGVSYNRDEWSHWATVRSCWDVREAVLARQAVAGSLKMQKEDGTETTSTGDACKILSGTWVDPYTGSTINDPGAIDIDHMIPLNYAAQHGGQQWDAKKKASYANNMDYSNHLLAVSAGANRSKSDRGPSEWKPDNKAHWCQYALDWTNISKTWSLTVSSADKTALRDMLATCPK